MYLVLEYLMYLVIVTVLAGILFGASVLAIVTKDKAPRIAEASMKAIKDEAPRIAEASRKAVHVGTRRIEVTHLDAHLPGQSTPETRDV